jgi:uncharacterized membrane protein YphA (DoxX/SURF4 family)
VFQRAWTFARGPYPTLVSRLALGLVFLAAGVGKAIDPAGFARDIRAYQMLPGLVVTVMAYGLPWLEIALAVYLLAGLYLRWAGAITGALLVIFMIAMGQALARGLTLNCGCFGAGIGGVAPGEEVSVGSILRDALWLLLAVHLVVVPSIWTLDERIRGRSGRPAAQESTQRRKEEEDKMLASPPRPPAGNLANGAQRAARPGGPTSAARSGSGRRRR